MSKPLYSICLICRDEEKTLPRLLESLKEFRQRGGEICAIDTGSKDNSVAILIEAGCKVRSVGEKYLLEVDNVMGINEKFVVDGEKQVVKKGDRYFNFSEARNAATELATNNFCFFYDCDEVSVAMDIDRINQEIQNGMTQAEYNFVFSYDSFGNEAVKFIQCKAYDKRYMKWFGIVHELIQGYAPHESKRVFFDESVYKLGHHQNQETGRHIYLTGLLQDCFNNPTLDRQVHYCSRELLWSGRPKSALKLFKEHTRLGGWAAERAESFIFMGDIYGQLGNPPEQVRMYNEAFYIDSGRNKALMQLAFFYRHNKNYQAAICYAKAALEIPYGGFYAENLAFYRELPNEILYQCYGYMGNVDAAKEHILKALEYQPYNQQYLRDTQFYFEYPDQGHIQGWMRFPELLWLYAQAKSGKYKNMYECGSWKGKSSHAILSGLKNVDGAMLTCVDTWDGSDDERDDTNWMAKKEDIFAEFKKNTAEFKNLKTIRKSSVRAAEEVADHSLDWCFIDMGHTKKDVLSDLNAWFKKVKKDGVICGHDFSRVNWMEVVEAVTEFFGREPDYVVDSIWVYEIKNLHPFIKFTYELAPETKDAEVIEVSNKDGELSADLINYTEGQKVIFKQSGDINPPISINGKPIIKDINVSNEAGDIKRGEVIDLKDEVQAIIRKHDEKKTELIPRKVFTVWLGDTMPELIEKCIESQRAMCEKFGYDFTLISLEFLKQFANQYKYLREAFGSTYSDGVKYCKMTDYLRMLYLKQHGGWFMDADIEILPEKSFNDLLGEKMVVGLEEANWEVGKVVLGTAIVGAMPNHPMITEWLETVERDHVGWDNRNYESSMHLLNLIGVKHQSNMRLLEPEYFYPLHWQSKQLNITPKTICIHHFSRTWIPTSTLAQFKYNIENNINFTFVKRGDGELACMNGEVGANCDGHPYSSTLRRRLKEAYAYFEVRPNTTIVEFDDQINYNVLLHRTDSNLKEVSEFYKAIRDCEREKFFIGPQKLQPVAEMLRAKHIVIPELNWWSEYESIQKHVPMGPEVIYLFCAGMPAKVLMHDIMKYEFASPQATYLDCGSAFDPSVSNTRTEQITKEQFWELYNPAVKIQKVIEPRRYNTDWTVGEEIIEIKSVKFNGKDSWDVADEKANAAKNFALPQENHPEKLWVIDNLK